MTSLDGALGLALFDDQYIQNPYPLYDEMHQTGPVHRVGRSGFYAVSSWDAVNEAVARCGDFSSNLTATMMYELQGAVTAFEVGEIGGAIQALATADEPAHSLHRKSLLPQLAAKRIRAFGPFISETAADIWNTNARGGHIEWMSAMANRLPMMIVGRIIGVPDADIGKLARWAYSATQMVEGLVTDDDMAAAGVSVMELGRYITGQFAKAAADPRDNLLGDLATACSTGVLDDVAALTMMITLFSAGGESTASLIGSGAWVLATQPAVQQQLRHRPELVGPFLEEVLRYEPPFRGHYRHVLHDTIPTRPPNGQEPHQFRQGNPLLCRSRARPIGSQPCAESTPRTHHQRAGRRHWAMVAEPSGAPPRAPAPGAGVTRANTTFSRISSDSLRRSG